MKGGHAFAVSFTAGALGAGEVAMLQRHSGGGRDLLGRWDALPTPGMYSTVLTSQRERYLVEGGEKYFILFLRFLKSNVFCCEEKCQ